jgi:hypothetical protein
LALAAAPLFPVKFVNRSHQPVESGFAIDGPCPFEDVAQGLHCGFMSLPSPADPFLGHNSS